MKKIIFEYNLEKDLKNYINNFLNHKYPSYGREKLNIGSLISIINRTNFDEANNSEKFIRENLEIFYNKNKSYFDDQLVLLQKEWDKRSAQYTSRLEEYFGVTIDFDATCYLTTLGIAPYNYEQKYFYAMMTRPMAAQITSIAHEFMHLVFRRNFDDYLKESDVDDQGILEINEALTVLINYEFFDLFVTPDQNNKPSIGDLKAEVVKLYKESKSFREILATLIKLRS